MEAFRITSISAQGVSMTRLPVTPAEESMMREALMNAALMKKDETAREALRELINEERLYPEGDRADRAPGD